MQVSILRPFHEIVMSYPLDKQKMLEMTILNTQTAEGQIVSTPRYKVPSRFYVFFCFLKTARMLKGILSWSAIFSYVKELIFLSSET